MQKRMMSIAVALTGLLSMVQAAPFATIKTNQGSIVIELNSEKAPKTVENFVRYAKEDFYNQTIFHRVIDGFMIQGGGFTSDTAQKPTHEPIAIESDNGLKNVTGTIAMARTSDPNSATSQFFINVVDNAFLDYQAATMSGYGYAVFGTVVEGMDVVNKIKAVPVQDAGMHQNVPTQPVIIEAVTITETLPVAEPEAKVESETKKVAEDVESKVEAKSAEELSKKTEADAKK